MTDSDSKPKATAFLLKTEAAPVLYERESGTAPRITLSVVDGPDRGARFQFLPPTMTIGRSDDNHFVLSDGSVSARHAEIRVDRESIVMTDLGSTNGTRVNGKRCETARLADGDEIALGNSTLRIRIPARRARGF